VFAGQYTVSNPTGWLKKGMEDRYAYCIDNGGWRRYKILADEPRKKSQAIPENRVRQFNDQDDL
jgi:hypothetical protein